MKHIAGGGIVVGGSMSVNFNVIYYNRMNYTKKKLLGKLGTLPAPI
jgi:hypothetical protein